MYSLMVLFVNDDDLSLFNQAKFLPSFFLICFWVFLQFFDIPFQFRLSRFELLNPFKENFLLTFCAVDLDQSSFAEK